MFKVSKKYTVLCLDPQHDHITAENDDRSALIKDLEATMPLGRNADRYTDEELSRAIRFNSDQNNTFILVIKE